MTRRDAPAADPWEALIATAGDAPTLSFDDTSPPGAQVTVVLGASGGAGATTVASGLALARAAAGHQVVLVELDLARGDLAGRWGVPAERTIDDLTAVIAELAPDHVQLVATPHPSGVHLLLAPEDHRAEHRWEAEAVHMLLRCAAQAGEVVVDAVPGARAEAACALADRIIVVGVPTLPGLRRARRLLAALDRGAVAAHPAVVLNRGVGRDHLGPRGCAAALGREVQVDLCRADRDADDVGAGTWPNVRRARLAQQLAALAKQATP